MKIIGKVVKEDIVDIRCDICGQSTKNEMGCFEFAQLKADWGYGSSKDGELHELYLCESCYDRVIAYIGSIGGNVSITH